MGEETDTGKFKFGDGATPWNGLPYAGGGGMGLVNFSAGTTSSNLSSVTFANSNGISFGLNGVGVITGTVQTNYLTTAMASNRSTDFVQATAGFHGTNASGTIASSGISVSVAAPTNNSINISAGTTSSNVTAVTFSNANGVSFGYDGTNVTATVATNYLTTAMASNRGSDFVQATAAFHGTNASGTINSNDISISVAAGSNSSWTVSDAVTSITVARLAFTNANGITLSLSTTTGGSATVVGSYTVPTVTNSSWTVSDSATSATVGRLAFTNGNGVTFALSTSNNGNQTISASVKTDYAGTNSGATNCSVTVNTSGVSVNVAAASNSSWTVSDSATSATVGRLAFVNGNGVTFALSTSNNGNQSISASVQTNYLTTAALSSQTLAFSLSGNIATTNSSQILNGGYALAGGNNVTLQQSNNTVSISVGNYITTGALSSQTLAFSLGGNSATTNSSQILNGGYVLAGGNNITIQQSNNTISISAGAAGAAITVSDSATSATIGRLMFSNANGVSFGLSTSNNGQQTLTATVQTNYLTTAALSSQTMVLANSQATYSTGTVNFVEGGGAITIATSAGGQSFKFSVPQTSSLVGVNGITVSTNGSTISISGFAVTAALTSNPMSYWNNLPVLQNTTTTMCQSNSFYVFPMTVDNNYSISYVRLLGSIAFTSTSIATSAVNNATGASTAFSETQAWNMVLYTVLGGASSRSLGYYTSTSVGLTWAVSVSQASTSNASNQSISQIITYPAEGFSTATASTQYSVSTSNGPISTTQWSNLSAQRFLDIPFATQLTAGNYWMALNRISGTVGGKNLDVNATTFGVSQMNLSFAAVNAATNVSNCAPQIGVGMWTTNAAQTSSSIAFASISATTSYMIPMVQFIRQA